MRHSLVAVGVTITLASAAVAQTSIERFERQLDQIYRDTRLRANPEVAAGQRLLLDYGGFLGLSFFAIDDVQQKTHILRQYDLIGYARLNLDNAHELFLRARTSYRDFNSGDSFDGEGDETIWPTVEQAYYRFDLARHLAASRGQLTRNNVVFQGGRQFVYWANGLVLGQTLDAVRVDLTIDRFELQLLGGVTIDRTIDFDTSRPDFDDDTNRGFYGALAAVRLGRHRPFVYGLIQRDYNDDDAVAIGPVEAKSEYNSFYIGAGINGSIGDRLLYGVEAVYEGGQGRSDVRFDPLTQTLQGQDEEDIQAAALNFRLDYLLADQRRSRLTGELILATGDSDRLVSNSTLGGNAPGTKDHSFNAMGLLNTGLAFAPSVSNVTVFRVGGSTFPLPTSASFSRLQVGADVLLFGKMKSDGAIDEPTSDDWYLGVEPDIFLNWQVTSDVTVAVRYGVFFPGTAIEFDDSPRHFFFAGVTLAF
jgi:hypothetical protein